jgi:hypothetical protein
MLGRRHPRSLHELFSVGLGAFQTRAELPGAKYGQACYTKAIRATPDQRVFGAENDDVGGDAKRQFGQTFKVQRTDGKTLGDLSDSRVPGGGEHLRFPSELPCQRMFTAARTDYENPHRAKRLPRARFDRSEA